MAGPPHGFTAHGRFVRAQLRFGTTTSMLSWIGPPLSAPPPVNRNSTLGVGRFLTWGDPLRRVPQPVSVSRIDRTNFMEKPASSFDRMTVVYPDWRYRSSCAPTPGAPPL